MGEAQPHSHDTSGAKTRQGAGCGPGGCLSPAVSRNVTPLTGPSRIAESLLGPSSRKVSRKIGRKIGRKVSRKIGRWATTQRPGISTTTFVDLMLATASTPGSSPRSSAASRLIRETIRNGPACNST
jgi:hypothetical protein